MTLPSRGRQDAIADRPTPRLPAAAARRRRRAAEVANSRGVDGICRFAALAATAFAATARRRSGIGGWSATATRAAGPW